MTVKQQSQSQRRSVTAVQHMEKSTALKLPLQQQQQQAALTTHALGGAAAVTVLAGGRGIAPPSSGTSEENERVEYAQEIIFKLWEEKAASSSNSNNNNNNKGDDDESQQFESKYLSSLTFSCDITSGVWRVDLPVEALTPRIRMPKKKQVKAYDRNNNGGVLAVFGRHNVLEEQLEERLEKYRSGGTELLFGRLTEYSKEERKRRAEEKAKTGHDFLAENLILFDEANGGVSQSIQKASAYRKMMNARGDVVRQRRNVVQYEKICATLDATREVKNAKKARESALAEFIMQRMLLKNSAQAKSWLTYLALIQGLKKQTAALKAFRSKKEQRAIVVSSQCVAGFMRFRLRIKKKHESISTVKNFLRFVRRDGIFKKCAKKLRWVLVKLQKMLRARSNCHKALRYVITLKFIKVVVSSIHRSFSTVVSISSK
jgi:hypothetical protein